MTLDKTRLAHAQLAQQRQLKDTGSKIGEITQAISGLESRHAVDMAVLSTAIARAESAIRAKAHGDCAQSSEPSSVAHQGYGERIGLKAITELDILAFKEESDSETFYAEVCKYADRHRLTLPDDPFRSLMPIGQRISLEKRIREEFTLKTAQCDRYDYMIAATSGLIGGLIDVLFVGAPGTSALGRMTDKGMDATVRKFADLNGWPGPREGSDPTASAIGFLERRFKVNYDHRHGGDVGNRFPMSTRNHHIKSLAHSPDLVGLFFSILNQFTNTASFVDSGKIITIDTKHFDLAGSNFVSKLFAGFVNWLGHLISDAGGSSGAVGRGSGIPIPFYSLLQFVNVGNFGQHRQTFAKVAVQVFESGYDLRHGAALAIPVLITELISRIAWVFKRRVVDDLPWDQCIPSTNNPEMRRVLCVAHGSLCVVDGLDAGLRSGGTVIGFMLHANLIAWTRFGVLSLKELTCFYRSGSLDVEAMDVHLEQEIRRLTSVRRE